MFHILAAKLHNSAEITKFSHLKKHKKFHKRLFTPPHALFYSLFPRFFPCRDASRHRAAPHPARRLAFPITPPRDSYFPLKKIGRGVFVISNYFRTFAPCSSSSSFLPFLSHLSIQTGSPRPPHAAVPHRLKACFFPSRPALIRTYSALAPTEGRADFFL